MCINSNNWDVNEKTKDIRLDRMNMNEPKTWREMVWKGQCGGWVKKIVCAVYIYTHTSQVMLSMQSWWFLGAKHACLWV